jgi:hypothetical protein
MKALNNPWVVGALAVTAVTMVGHSILQPKWARPGIAGRGPATARRSPPDGSTSIPKSPSINAETTTNVPARLTNVDTDYFEAHVTDWVQAPRRDPFHLLTIKPVRKTAAPSPVPTWSLNAIWQQEGKPLVAINRKVYREGEVIEGYRIARIDEALVWFQGPDGLESLGFGKRAPRIAGTASVHSNQH